MTLDKFFLENKFLYVNPVEKVYYYTKSIGDNCYDVYIYPDKVTIYIYDKEDNETSRNFYFTGDTINFLNSEIRKAKINKLLCQQQ
jgi:hypothetical protein